MHLRPVSFMPFPGQSNPSFLIKSARMSYVLRKKPPGELLPKAHMVRVQPVFLSSSPRMTTDRPRVRHD